jgi:phage terminase small subunit
MSTATNAEKKLTPKQEQFCLEYIIDFNATQAAIRAGYSKKTAYSIGQQNLKKLEIMQYLAVLKDERQERARKSADEVLEEIENVGFSRVNNTVEWNESGIAFIKNSDEIEDKDAAAIESIQVTEKYAGKGEDMHPILQTKVKLHPKIPALTLLAKHHNLIKEQPILQGDWEITWKPPQQPTSKSDEKRGADTK